MIQINLIPDVKQELLKAQAQRNAVVSLAVVVGIISLSAVALGAAFVYGGQAIANGVLDGRINDESQKLLAVEDLSNTLTIQNQLVKVNQTHADKNMTSRQFDILAATVPPAPNNVTITNFAIDPLTNTISIQAQSPVGYSAAETFSKTIRESTISFTRDGSTEKETLPITDFVSIGEGGFGETAEGTRVLRFSLSFVYIDELFSSEISNVEIKSPIGPRVATDSRAYVPDSIFEQRATDIEGEE